MSLLIYIFAFDILSGVVLMLTMPILIAFLILLGVVAQKYANAQWGSYQLLSRHFVDSLRGLLTLKYLGQSKSINMPLNLSVKNIESPRTNP